MILVRKQHHAFGRGSMEWVITDNPSLAVYTRKDQDETLLVINNLSDAPQTVTFPPTNQGLAIDLLTGLRHSLNSSVTLQPYAHLWLKQDGK